MKRRIIIIFVMMFVFITTITCFASNDKEKSIVYVSGDELEFVYSALQKDRIPAILESDGLSIVKESISRVFYLDTLECARASEITIKPLFDDDENSEPIYIAKLTDKNANYAGNIRFKVKDGIAYQQYTTIKSETASTQAPCSYADHAERIRKCLGEEELIPPTDVIYVLAEALGDFFYIKNEKHDQFICVGYLHENDAGNYSCDYDWVLTAEEFKELCNQELQRYERDMAEYDEWRAEHPDEEYPYIGGYGVYSTSNQTVDINDIIDISEYLDVDYSVNRSMPDYVKLPVKLSAEKTNIRPIIILSASVAAVAAAAVVCVIALKKKKHVKVS